MVFEHGAHAYTNHKCRCEVCTGAWRVYTRELRARRRAALIDGCVNEEHIKHNAATYANYGCRCEVCTGAKTAATRQARQRRQAEVHSREPL